MVMTTRTARQFKSQQIHYLRRSITFADNGAEREVGVIPAGSLIVKPVSGVFVSEAFNAGSSNVVDIGTQSPVDNDDVLGTDLALGSTAFVPLDEAVGDFLVADDTLITATVALGGTAASAGKAEVVIAYIPDNDL